MADDNGHWILGFDAEEEAGEEAREPEGSTESDDDADESYDVTATGSSLC